MLSIKNNPYRTLGILVGASARDVLNRTKKLRMYLEAEQKPDEDFSFPILGTLHRTSESVSEAPVKLNLNQDRVNAALFWFLNGSIADEPAFDFLKEGNKQSAVATWSKLTSSGKVTYRNYSAFQNLSTLLLNSAFSDPEIKIALLEAGVLLKLRFLESDCYKAFVQLVTDETFTTTKVELQKVFLSNVLNEAIKKGLTAKQFLSILDKMPFSAKSEYLKIFALEPLEKIEKHIEEAKKKRKANPEKAAVAGKNLFSSVQDHLNQLKTVLGPSDIKFNNTSDKVAEEVLQCGVDYFKHFQNSDFDPSMDTMECLQKAKIIAVGTVTKQRCLENIGNLQEWIDDKPNREKQRKVVGDLEIIKNLIDEYDNKSQNIAYAKELLTKSRPHLQNIKAVLGSNDELYIGLSTRIASDAQGMTVAEINAVQNHLNITHDHIMKIAGLAVLKKRVDEAWEVTTMIGNMDLRNDFRNHFNTNKQSLSSLRSQLASINLGSGGVSSRPQSQPSSSTSGGGCYIATMVYGDYEHPQVLALRQFRDEVLSKSKLGLWFIKTYYRYSPKLVVALKDKKNANNCIRFILNQLIKIINR